MARFRARTAAHLRSRGEDSSSSSSTSTATSASSPPLARKGPCPDRTPPGRSAHLRSRGEDGDCSPPAARPAAHLCSRGEDFHFHPRDLVVVGSPPLARRGPLVLDVHAEPPRLTSARAERTRTRGPARVHGSPPLARRGLGDRVPGTPLERLTSARAERTAGTSTRTARTPAHLRSRGEDSRGAGGGHAASGSPPLARRGLAGHEPAVVRPRLTSARAERTPPARPRSTAGTAHLRSRGEDGNATFDCRYTTGSPPLARRGLPRGRALPVEDRLTSARAERTAVITALPSARSAHLRSRGEDTLRPALLIRLFHCFTDDSRQGMGLGCVGPADSAYAVWPGRGQTA
ncbi:hypothetical protein RKD39_000131 [Streptomyces albogriseolus]